MPARPAAVELLAALSNAIAGRRWYLFGAQAVNLHGRPRMTADVDVTVEIDRADVPALVRRLSRAGFELRVSHPERFMKATSVLPFVHRDTTMPLDVVLAASGLEAAFLERAVFMEVADGVSVPVISAADLVVAKLLAGRPKDIDDAASVLEAANVDAEAIRALLGEIEAALGQSDLTPLFEDLLADARRRRMRARASVARAKRPKRAPRKR